MDEVASITIPGVFEDLAVLGNICGKQSRYRRFLTDDCQKGNQGEVDGPVYCLSEPGTLRIRDDVFTGGREMQVVEFVSQSDCKNGKQGLPAFFETRYIFRAQCAAGVKVTWGQTLAGVVVFDAKSAVSFG